MPHVLLAAASGRGLSLWPNPFGQERPHGHNQSHGQGSQGQGGSQGQNESKKRRKPSAIEWLVGGPSTELVLCGIG